MRVLITGHRGYIGSVLTGLLRRSRFDVVGLDNDLYRDCDFGRVQETVASFDCDAREIQFADLVSFDAVVHLAALPGSAAPGLDASVTASISRETTLHLARCCKKAGIPRFLFASSCEVYGRNRTAAFTEDDQPDPWTTQAKSQLATERALSRMADREFDPTILRVPEVFGISPRLRLDLTLNDMAASAVTNDRVVVGSDARAWRPFVHVEDLSRAIAILLTSPDEPVRGRTFNLAAPDDNYRLIDVADMVTELVPGAVRSISPYAAGEPSYRVDSSLFSRTFPEFSFRWTLPKGIGQLRNAMVSAGLTAGEWRSDRYRRLPRLLSMIERGELDTATDSRLPLSVKNTLAAVGAG